MSLRSVGNQLLQTAPGPLPAGAAIGSASVSPSGQSIIVVVEDGAGNVANLSALRSPFCVQQLALDAFPAGGTFTLTFAGQTTAPIAVSEVLPSSYGLWTVPVTAGHPVQIAATWAAFSWEATGELFEVFDSDGTTPLGSATFNTTLTPSSFADGTNPDGSPTNWQTIGTFTPTGTTIRVRMSAPNGQFLIADGLWVKDTSTGVVQYLDDQGGAFAMTAETGAAAGAGHWYGGTYTQADGHGAGTQLSLAASAIQSALSSLSSVPSGGLEVTSSSNAGPYTVTFGGTLAGSQPLLVCSDPAVVPSLLQSAGAVPTISINGGSAIELLDPVWGAGLPNGFQGASIPPYIPFVLYPLPQSGPGGPIVIAPADVVTFSVTDGWASTAAGPVSGLSNYALANHSGGSLFPALSPSDVTMQVGYNCTGSSAYGFGIVHANIAKGVSFGGANGYDANGYPTVLAASSAGWPLTVGAPDPGGVGKGTAAFPSGHYTIRWDGACLVDIVVGNGGTATLVSQSLTGGAGNRRVYDVQANPAVTLTPTSYINFHSSASNAPYTCDVQNLRVYPPDIDPDNAPLFHPTFISKFGGVTSIRFMDPLNTNHGNIREFSDFHTASRAGYLDATRNDNITVTQIAGYTGTTAFDKSVLVVLQLTLASPHGLVTGQWATLNSSGTVTASNGSYSASFSLGDIGRRPVQALDATTLLIGFAQDNTNLNRVMTNTLTGADAGYLNIAVNPDSSGIAFSDMAALCNEVGANMYMNIPPNASDDCITQMATQVAAGLNPGLKCRVEYGNEVWNYGFDSFSSCILLSVLNGLGGQGNPYPYFAYRTTRAHSLCKAAFTAVGRPDDLIRVMGGFGAEYSVAGSLAGLANQYTNTYGTAFDELCVAPYFDNQSIYSGGEPTLQATYDLLTVDQILDLLDLNILYGGIGNVIGGQRPELDAQGFTSARIICYEGGPDVLVPSGASLNFNERCRAVARHPRMYGVMLGYLKQLQDAGCTLFNDYTLNYYPGPPAWGAYYGWNMQPGTGDPVADAINISDFDALDQIKSEVGGAMNFWASLVGAPTPTPAKPKRLIPGRNGQIKAIGFPRGMFRPTR